MKVYISGKITGNPDYKAQFAAAEKHLKEYGHDVMNPAVLGQGGFEWEEYMHVSYAMIDVCDLVYMLRDWVDSKGARREHAYAHNAKKQITYQGAATMTRLEYLRSLSIEDFAKAILEIGTNDPAYCDGLCDPLAGCSTENELKCCIRWLEESVAGKMQED